MQPSSTYREPIRRIRRDSLLTKGNGLKLKEGRMRSDMRRKFFTQRQCGPGTAARSSGCPIPGGIPGQVGWGSGAFGLEEDVPAHGRVVE